MAKYVKNNKGVSIEIWVCDRLEIEDDTGRKIRQNKKLFAQKFDRIIVDKFTGNLLSDGWTEVDDDKYTALVNDKMCGFNTLVKNGTFTVSDNPPVSSAAAVQKYASDAMRLKAENDALRAELEALKAAKATKKRAKKTEDSAEDKAAENTESLL